MKNKEHLYQKSFGFDYMTLECNKMKYIHKILQSPIFLKKVLDLSLNMLSPNILFRGGNLNFENGEHSL